MKRLLVILAAIISLHLCVNASTSEKFNYIVTYKWGLINKDAGEVEIIKQPKGDGYELKLIARTKPWADRIYKVRDTLISVTGKEKYRPINYTYIAHEKNKYRKEQVKFTYAGNKVKGSAERYKEDKNGNVKHTTAEMESTLPTYDMLSVYFFLRELDYANMKPGETLRASIFSGSKHENLDVRCEGIETVELRDKSKHEAWHIVFKFTQQGGKKSSDDINCWISTDSRHVPLLIVGNLPIGQIRVHHVE